MDKEIKYLLNLKKTKFLKSDNKKRKEQLQNLINNFFKNNKPLDNDISKLIDDNIMDLLA